MSRRLFLSVAAALAATPLLARQAAAQAQARPTFRSDPFTLGVASGDPDDTSVVLWTRLAPEPLTPSYGMEASPVQVQWEVAEDDAMTRVVRHGVSVAAPALGHSVHVEVSGLKPDRWYWYRFRAGDAETKVARTRTLPAPSASPGALRFAFASCQQFEEGYYTAYQRMADDELDLVCHLGDYIYEGAGSEGRPRRHVRGLLKTLDDYRIRHAQYRTDPHLQAMHARCPWFVTWDDHEVSNNYAAQIAAQPGADVAAFLARRAAAYQAYYEAMPLRARSLPKGPDLMLYRNAAFGQLAQFSILDTRQYRTDQPNNDQPSPINDAALDPNATLMGAEQRAWLRRSLSESKATWNVIAQQVLFAMLARPNANHPEQLEYSMDVWAGYARERMDLVQFMAERKISNPVILTGDIHANFANEIRVDDRQADRPIIASEFVGTSVTSGGDGVDKPDYLNRLMADNAGLRFHNRQRGYVRCTVTPQQWQSDYITLDQVSKGNAPATTRASLVVESGDPRIKTA